MYWRLQQERERKVKGVGVHLTKMDQIMLSVIITYFSHSVQTLSAADCCGCWFLCVLCTVSAADCCSRWFLCVLCTVSATDCCDCWFLCVLCTVSAADCCDCWFLRVLRTVIKMTAVLSRQCSPNLTDRLHKVPRVCSIHSL